MEPQKKHTGLWIVLVIFILGVLVYMFMGTPKDESAQNKVSNTASAENELNSLDTSSLEDELVNIEKELN